MTDYRGQDLSESRFDDVSLERATFHDVTFRGARFRLVDLSEAVVRGALLVDVEISGELENVRINGVDVVPLVEAELDRRHPERPLMRPVDAAGFRAAWEVLERLWPQTIDRARALPPALLHERVDDEWSFIETLRHLVFVTDTWLARAVLGDPSPWSPLDLPHDEMAVDLTVPRDRTVRPSLDEVLVLLDDRRSMVRTFLATLTDAQLAGDTGFTLEPGYPEPVSYPVRRCLQAVVTEEWEHRLIAERDLATLVARTP